MTMTVEKRTFVKLLRYILMTALILVIAVAAIGCEQGGSNPEQRSQMALNQLLSCTLQQAEDFDAALTQSSIEAVADSEIGLTQNDDELRDYLIKRFGDSMTDKCIEDLAMSRTFYQSIALTQKFSSDIEASEIEITKRSGEQECYNFSAEIKASTGDSIATAWGSISMKKDGTQWKASKITLTMDEIHN